MQPPRHRESRWPQKDPLADTKKNGRPLRCNILRKPHRIVRKFNQSKEMQRKSPNRRSHTCRSGTKKPTRSYSNTSAFSLSPFSYTNQSTCICLPISSANSTHCSLARLLSARVGIFAVTAHREEGPIRPPVEHRPLSSEMPRGPQEDVRATPSRGIDELL